MQRTSRLLFIATLFVATVVQIPRVAQAQGTVAGWGGCCGYDFGQVTPPAGLSNVTAITAGSYFSLALTVEGRVVGWGANGSGPTGDYGQTHPPTDLSNVVAIAAGELHSLALTASGKVVAWGYNGSGQTNVPAGLSNVVAIAAAGAQSLALTAAGTVVSWGDNSAGQRSIPASASNVVAIAAGDYFDLALTALGKVVGWGNNSYGQITVPNSLSNVVAIAAGSSYGNGESFSLALTSSKQVVGWGGNNFGQTTIPSGLTNVVAISAGWYHALALKSDGTVVAWGAVGAAAFGQTSVPAGLSNVVAIAGGNVHSLALIGKIPLTGSCTPPPSGLASWWQAESNAVDTISGNNGMLSNGVSFAAGEVGTAFSLNGTGAHVRVPASASLNIGQNGALTIEMWIKPSAVDGFRPIVEWNDGAQDGVQLWFGSGTGILFANLRDTALNAHWFTSGAQVVAPNVWQHVALTYDRTNGISTLYLNGTIVAQANLGSFTPLTTADFCLGRRPADSVYYAGLMDELSLYHRALSQSEIQAIYNAGSAGKCFTNLIAPVITTQPASQTVSVGGTAVFNVTATGTPTLSYQWQFNGTNLSGAIASSLVVSNVAQTNLGAYSVIVSNPANSVTSSNAMLSMYPYLRAPFTGIVTVWGQNAMFTVVVGGSGPFSFQWLLNGIALQDATNQTLILPSIQFTNAGYYSVVVGNPFGSVTNVPAQVVVNPAGVSLGLYPGVTVTGTIGYTYNIQASVDLTNTNGWTTVATLTLLQPIQLWVDTSVNTTLPAHSRRFYRVVPGP